MFEKKIKPLLQYIGTIGATILSIIYMFVIGILIAGFKAHTWDQILVFALINAAFGCLITFFLREQGRSFARNIPENDAVVKEYYGLLQKQKKYRTLRGYYISTTITDILCRATGVILGTLGIMWIVIQGTNDWMMAILAVVNLFLFICFGLLALASMYDFYNTQWVPRMKYEIELRQNKKIKFEKEIKTCLNSMEKNLETLKNKS